MTLTERSGAGSNSRGRLRAARSGVKKVRQKWGKGMYPTSKSQRDRRGKSTIWEDGHNLLKSHEGKLIKQEISEKQEENDYGGKKSGSTGKTERKKRRETT